MDATGRATLKAMAGLEAVAMSLSRPEKNSVLAVIRQAAHASRGSGSSGAAIEAMARLVPVIRRLEVDVELVTEVQKDYLLSFAALTADSGYLPADKLCRWVGFVMGALAARGVLDLSADDSGLPSDGVDGLDRLSVALGYVQGILVVRGLLDVTEERDRTRPIFHAAYDEAGISKPGSVSVGKVDA